jgi:hypothetical protein
VAAMLRAKTERILMVEMMFMDEEWCEEKNCYQVLVTCHPDRTSFAVVTRWNALTVSLKKQKGRYYKLLDGQRQTKCRQDVYEQDPL